MCKENVIENIQGEKHAGVTAAGGSRLKSKILKLAAEHPDDVKVLVENTDGSIFAHVPYAWVRINPPRQLSDESKKVLADRLKKAREAR